MSNWRDSEAQVCHHWIGSENRYCSSTVGVRRYLPGLCCPLHTPGEVARRSRVLEEEEA